MGTVEEFLISYPNAANMLYGPNATYNLQFGGTLLSLGPINIGPSVGVSISGPDNS